jgi:Asp-tRNA(Asn)/Glu-tRNA(Gln) amidotransferase A subunit family amidase
LQQRGALVEEGIPEDLHRIGAVIVAYVLTKDNFSPEKLQETMRDLGAERDPLLIAAVTAIRAWQQSVPRQTQQADAARFVELQQRFSVFMDDVDALLLPVLAEPAMKHGEAGLIITMTGARRSTPTVTSADSPASIPRDLCGWELPRMGCPWVCRSLAGDTEKTSCCES